jgi:uncharacterized protein (TIGR02147 family)
MYDGRLLLLQELTARKQRNSSYSLRAFARDLGISAAALSQYMSRKRELSPKNRRSIATRMKLSPLEQKQLEAKPRELTHEEASHESLSEDQFRLIGDWLSLAVLNLARLRENRAEPKWIANRLGVSLEEATDVLDRLLRLNLVETKDKRLVRTSKPLTTTSDVPSEAIQKYHLGLLRKAERALLDLPVTDRDVTSITMPTDPEKLLEAKKILKRTAHRIAKLVATDAASEVHVLSMQLFPLTQDLNPKRKSV